MAAELFLTDGAFRCTSVASTQTQLLSRSVDVSAYDQADLILTVHSQEGTVGAIVVSIIGGMQLESEDGWVTLESFPQVSTGNTSVGPLNVSGLPRYIRWKVTTFSSQTAVTFSVRGMLRMN